MANEIKIEAYTFSIRTVNSERTSENRLLLDDVNGDDFFTIFRSYLEEFKEMGIEDNLQKALKLVENTLRKSDTRRSYAGTFSSGGYGLESDIVGTDGTFKMLKEKDMVEMLPFYFRIHIPASNIGVLILQRVGIHGISGIVKKTIHDYLRRNNPGISIDFAPLVTKELIRAYLNSNSITEIILRKYGLPSDKAQAYGLGQYTQSELNLELRLKAGRGFSGLFNKINSYLADPNGKFFDYKELREIGFDDLSKISVVSEVNGAPRTVDLSDTMKFRPYYDIDEDVVKEKSGHPTFASVDRIAKAFLETFINETDEG